MIESIGKELIQRKSEIAEPIETIYFGGGTPSLLSMTDLESLLNAVHQHYNTSNLQEITFELNPEDSNKTYLNNLKLLGVNRLSIGIQTFDSKILSWMNRAHSADQAKQCLKDVSAAGFTNFSCDLIFGTEYHTNKLIESDIATLSSFGPTHISTYSLTVEERTAFHALHKKGCPIVSGDMDVIDQMNLITQLLEKSNFERYEISNYGKPGSFSLHNSSYWLNKPYIGVGPSSHSYSGNERRANVRNNKAYINAIQTGEAYYSIEHLGTSDFINEHILTRLRTKWGVDLKYISSLDSSYQDKKQFTIKDLIEDGQVSVSKDHLFITPQGTHLIDSITSELFI